MFRGPMIKGLKPAKNRTLGTNKQPMQWLLLTPNWLQKTPIAAPTKPSPSSSLAAGKKGYLPLQGDYSWERLFYGYGF